MQQFEKIDIDELTKYLDDARGDLTDKQFTDRYLTGVIKSIKADPKLYRSYGPYWWALKQLILTHKDNDGSLGHEYDTAMSNAFRYDNEAITICAAFHYQQMTLDSGYMYSNKHQATTSNSEVIDLVIEDSDIERVIFASTFK